MAVQGRTSKKKVVGPKKLRQPKALKRAATDLAPSSSRSNSLTRREREIQEQMQKQRRGEKYVKKVTKQPKVEALPVPEFKTELRENESMRDFENRLRMERLRIERGMGTFEHKTSQRRLDYKRERRQEKAEKKRAKKAGEEKDDEFTGSTDHIAFGDRVERPPCFEDLALPGDAFMKLNRTKKEESNLEKLQKALKTANSDVRSQFSNVENPTETDEQRKIRIKLQQEERKKLLDQAREQQRQVTVEKARIQAQEAYKQLKSKRGGSTVNIGNLTAHTSTIYAAGVKAAKNSLDGGVYHHGR
jgi:uncharacterized protein with PIN domain